MHYFLWACAGADEGADISDKATKIQIDVIISEAFRDVKQKILFSHLFSI